MTTTDTEADVIVIGLGPGGEAVAGELARAGLTVIGIEANLVGGECPYWGCVPSKMMIRAAGALAEGRRIEQLAGGATVTPDWSPVAKRIREQATDDWDDTAAVERFVDQGGHFVRGRATITAPRTVEVDGVTYTAPKLVIATGTAADVPPIDGLAGTPFWTNHEMVEAEELPASMIVLGGGAIGSELAQVAARFGVEVSLIEGTDRLLPQNEPEAGEVLAEALAGDGITVHTGQVAERVVHDDAGTGGFTVFLADGSEVTGETLLVATGRRTFLEELGVENLGLDPAGDFLEVDGYQRVVATAAVWSVGDIAGEGQFTHLATRQAAVAAADILGRPVQPLNLDALPSVTFTDPEVGAVGLTEAQARDRGLPIKVATKPVGDTTRGWLHGVGNDGLIKLVADADRDVLVGATSVGPVGGEVLGLLSLAVHGQVPLGVLRSMIYAYPTFHKGVEATLSELD